MDSWQLIKKTCPRPLKLSSEMKKHRGWKWFQPWAILSEEERNICMRKRFRKEIRNQVRRSRPCTGKHQLIILTIEYLSPLDGKRSKLLDDFTEDQVTGSINIRWEIDENGKDLCMTTVVICKVSIDMRMMEAEDKIWSLFRDYLRTLQNGGNCNLPQNKKNISIEHITSKLKRTLLRNQIKHRIQWIKAEHLERRISTCSWERWQNKRVNCNDHMDSTAPVMLRSVISRTDLIPEQVRQIKRRCEDGDSETNGHRRQKKV